MTSVSIKQLQINKLNKKIYNTIISKAVNNSLKGIKVTVFAYGQTGSGKTYTMLGSKDQYGHV